MGEKNSLLVSSNTNVRTYQLTELENGLVNKIISLFTALTPSSIEWLIYFNYHYQ